MGRQILAEAEVGWYTVCMSRKSINAQLREAIEKSDMSRYRISAESGVSQAVLSRFVNGQADLTLAKAEKICEALGIDLSLKKRK
jgi:transcriptional regulator with XRE-family HTH domain